MESLSDKFWIIWGCMGWAWGVWWLGWSAYYRWLGKTKVDKALEKIEALRIRMNGIKAYDSKMVG